MRKLYRNIAIVTAVFMLALGAMLAVSYYQMRQVSPLESGVMQTLKEMNDGNAENESLQKQIRKLDLISRKAYFVQESQLKTGAYLLLGMACILIVCLNLYYKETKNLPEKELDPIDEWMSKTKARKYLTIASTAALVITIGLILLQHIDFKGKAGDSDGKDSLMVEDEEVQQRAPEDEAVTILPADSIATDSLQAEGAATDSLPIPKITSKAFRGNNSSATSSAHGIATSWDLKSKKNILWQSAIPKHGYNSPIISGRNVFITGADKSARELYCYDVYTGELKWTVVANNIPGSPSSAPKVNADTGLAASTAATNGEQVCAIFATGDIICADMNGNRLWAKNLGVPDNHYGYASSLQMYGSNVIVQYQNNGSSKIVALNAKTGNQAWSKTTSDKIAWSSPIIATLGGKTALVVMGNPAIAAYNPSNGKELWRVECMSGEVGASPASAAGIVYGASEYAKCIAIDGATGQTLWEASDYLPECSSLAATKSLVFCATSYGMVCAYDAQTGEVKKEHDLSTPFYSSPVVVDGKVFLFSNSGKAYIFSSSSFDLITSFDTGEKTFATPAFTDNMMIVRTDKSIYCVKKN